MSTLATLLLILTAVYIMIPRFRRRPHIWQPPDQPAPHEHPSPPPEESWCPSPKDVYRARALLRELKLPTELVLAILEFADYHPRVRASRRENICYHASSGKNNSIASLYLSTRSIPKPDPTKDEEYKITYLQFKMNSCDQGWCDHSRSRGTYEGTWTWFETSILRPVPGQLQEQEPLETFFSRQPIDRFGVAEDVRDRLQEKGWDFVPRPQVEGESEEQIVWLVQANKAAVHEAIEHEVEWLLGVETEILLDGGSKPNGKGDGKAFLETLKPGDRVVLWARAMYPGWMNHVLQASMEIGYDVK